MTLSPSQSAVLACLKKGGIRYLPKGAKPDNGFIPESVYTLGCKWAYSWEISQEAKTVDYRKRISELNRKSYNICSFHVSMIWQENGRTVIRHGYILVAEP